MGVIGFAVGELLGAERGGCGGQVFVLEKGGETGECCDRAVFDCLAARQQQARLVSFGNAIAHVGERIVEAACFRVVVNLGLDRWQDAIHDDSRQRETGAHASAHVVDVFGEITRDLVQPGDIVFVIVHRRHRQTVGHAQHGHVKAVEGIEWNAREIQLVGMDRIPQHPLQELVVDALVRTERLGVDGLEPVQKFPLRGQAAFAVGHGHPGQQVVVVGYPGLGRHQWVLAQAIVPMFVDNGVQLGFRGLRRVRCRCGRARGKRNDRNNGDA